MILRFSGVVVRYRGRLLVTALLFAGLAVAGAVRQAAEPTGELVDMLTVAGAALLAGAMVAVGFRRRADEAGFEVDEERRSFRTPRSAAPVFTGLFLLAAAAAIGGAGGWAWAHGDRDGGWVFVMVLLGAGVVAAGPAAWRGAGAELTGDGIRGDQSGGSVFIPWTALSAERPARDDHHVDLRVAHPEQVVRKGLVVRPHRVPFEAASSAFVAGAIRHYAANPAERAAIGTRAGYRELAALLDQPLRPQEPPTSRRRLLWRGVGGGAAFLTGITLQTFVEADTTLGLVLSLIGLGLIGDAARGLRARRQEA
ncbi:hypothetical protein AB0J83_24045 [Actinoplanes sp. NPDC049596]|uniref:hypothetical protein n=1 Tax=unclassified Actinoplanes TaxID=2626549 RepID=UPI00341365DE